MMKLSGEAQTRLTSMAFIHRKSGSWCSGWADTHPSKNFVWISQV